MTAFVDTGVWYAAADRGDRSNARAQKLLASVAGELVTTDHVLVETWRLLAHRMGRHAAERFWEGLRGGAADVVPVGPADLEAAGREKDLRVLPTLRKLLARQDQAGR